MKKIIFMASLLMLTFMANASSTWFLQTDNHYYYGSHPSTLSTPERVATGATMIGTLCLAGLIILYGNKKQQKVFEVLIMALSLMIGIVIYYYLCQLIGSRQFFTAIPAIVILGISLGACGRKLLSSKETPKSII